MFLIGCGNTPLGPLEAQDSTLAYSFEEDVYLIQGDGSGLKKVIGGGYYQARISPDKTRIACVYQNDYKITILNLGNDLTMVGKPKEIYNAQAVAVGAGFKKSYYPTWSSDGNKVFFLNANHLVVYDYQAQLTNTLFDFPENETGGLTAGDGNLGLAKSGDSLYCMLNDGPDDLVFWAVDPNSGQGTQITRSKRSSILGLSFPPELPDSAIETLFGAKENPVLDPIPSTSGNFFFYLQEESGLLAKSWLRGYDREKKRKFDSTVLHVSLYKG